MNLDLTVCDYDRIGSSSPIGRVVLGYNRRGQEAKHWREMIENPRRPVIHWHTLQVVWSLKGRSDQSSMWIEKQHMHTRMDRSAVCLGLGLDRSAMLFSHLSTISLIGSFVVISVYLLYCNRCCLASEPGTGRGWLRSNRQLGSHWSGRAWLQSQR